MPSIGIYSYELFSVYDVDQIIRIGSAGAYVPELNLGDVVLEESAWSESTFAHTQNGYDKDTIYPDPELNAHILEAAKRNHITVKPVKVHSSDVFYTEPNVRRLQRDQRKTWLCLRGNGKLCTAPQCKCAS